MKESGFQDSPIVLILRLLGDLMGLNLLFLVTAFPVVTLGASLTAMYAVLISRERNGGAVEVIKTYFRNFIRDFVKATLLGLIVFAFLGVAFGDIFYGAASQPPLRTIFITVGTIIAIIGLIQFLLAFAQHSTYRNSIKNYLKNSFFLAFCAPGRLILSLLAWIVPWGLMILDPDVFLLRFGFLYLMAGFSFPAWATAKLFNGIFIKTEENKIAEE